MHHRIEYINKRVKRDKWVNLESIIIKNNEIISLVSLVPFNLKWYQGCNSNKPIDIFLVELTHLG